MSREDVQKLLGGYATGTLTPEEKEALFTAALEDQELFDALAKEQPLHELLTDPASRAHLLAAIEERPDPWYRTWWRPAAGVAAIAAFALLVILVYRSKPEENQAVQVAQATPAEPGPASSNQPSLPAVRPKLRPFHPPAPTPAPKRRLELPPPPEVAAPTLEPQALPALPPAAQPRTALGFREQGGAVGGVPPAPQVALFSAGQLAKENIVATQTGAAQERSMARVSPGSGNIRPAAAAPLPRMGVRYTIFRRSQDGDFTEVAPGDLKKGDAVQLRFEPNQSGYITVTALNGSRAPRVVAYGFAGQSNRFVTPVLEPDETELRVVFSRSRQPAGAFPTTKVRAADAAGKSSNYEVVSDDNQQVTLPITLVYR